MSKEDQKISNIGGLRLFRLVSLVLIIFLFATWFVGAYYFVRGISTDLDAILQLTFEGDWSAETVKNAADGLGIPHAAPSWFWLGLEVLMVATSGAIGILLFWRKQDWFGTYLGLTFVLVATRITAPVSLALSLAWPALAILLEYLSMLAVLAFFGIGYIFPNGRFVPRWSLWISLIVFLSISVLGLILPLLSAPTSMDLLEVTMLSYMAFGVVAQVYRYLRVSDPLERQQTKWVLVSLILFISLTGLLIVFFPNVFAASVALTPSDLAVWGIFYFLLVTVMMLFFGGITMAVLRYRLWDIDILIRRTLVYALLTATLILVYFGSVILLQTLFATVTGQQSAGAIVISTLLIAALFQPLRQSIQALIDRRFFRSKYDASQALAQFAQTARDEVDLEHLTDALIRVVKETMQPDKVLLWLPQSTDEE